MVDVVIAIISLLGFSFSCRYFLAAIVKPLPVFNTTSFSRSALRVERVYQVFSWGVMTAVFVSSLIYSGIEVYFTL